MGGEKLHRRMRTSSSRGSPPRGRGKGSTASSISLSIRITPAWAGKSSKPIEYLQEAGDHPRVGGEKSSRVTNLSHSLGSPPRGRGKVLMTLNITMLGGSPPRGRGKGCRRPPRCGAGGITPAWAGKSNVFILLRLLSRDHPRVGGEKSIFLRSRHRRTGSPPRGRGKVRTPLICRARQRITPAWAGKRRSGAG